MVHICDYMPWEVLKSYFNSRIKAYYKRKAKH